MGGWALNSIGRQKGPACTGRLRARWRQVDVENMEAIAVRRQWMSIIGCEQAEIDEHCNKAFDLSLEDELEQLSAAKRLAK